MLLGLPFSGSDALSTVALTAPLDRHRYGQSPLPASEENDESFGETAPDEGVIEETRGAVADFPERAGAQPPIRDRYPEGLSSSAAA